MIGLIKVHSERTMEQFHDARGEVSYPEKKYNTHHGEGFSIRYSTDTSCLCMYEYVYRVHTIHMYSN